MSDAIISPISLLSTALLARRTLVSTSRSVLVDCLELDKIMASFSTNIVTILKEKVKWPGLEAEPEVDFVDSDA